MRKLVIIFALGLMTAVSSSGIVSCSKPEEEKKVTPTPTPDPDPTPTPEPEVSITQEEIAIILSNIQNRLLQDWSSSVTESSSYLLSHLGSDGSFDIVDYSSTSSGNWALANHTSYVRMMALAYTHPSSSLCGNKDLYNGIVNACRYWAGKDPECSNWWYQHIDTPQKMGAAMCLMECGKEKLPEDVKENLYKAVIQQPTSGSYFTGANKNDICMGWIFLYTAMGKGQELVKAVESYYEPFAYTTEDGIHKDFGYGAHNQQFYNSQYGIAALTTFIYVAYFLKGTSLESAKYNKIIDDYVCGGIVPLRRGVTFMPSACGRMAVSYPGGLYNYSASFAYFSELFPEHKDIYDAAVLRQTGSVAANYKVEPYHHQFWTLDYTIHVRPEYTVGVRANSYNRVSKVETHTNNVNLLGYFSADGMMDVQVDGDEYLDIFPVWQWSHLPGVTAPALENSAIYHPTKYYYSNGVFTGGVCDGKIGCAVYDYIDSQNGIYTQAHKGYFFFDNIVVALGSAVKSSNANEIHTTVNQCLLQGTITAETSNGSSVTVTGRTFSDLRWLHHDKVCYYFPEDETIKVRGGEQTGAWSQINNDAELLANPVYTETVSKNVFFTYINHGVNPDNGKYVYMLIPGKNSIAEGKAALGNIIYGNDADLQWVYDKDKGDLEAVFYKAGTLKTDFCTIEVSDPCCLMMRGTGTSSETVLISDPAHKIINITLKVTTAAHAEKSCTTYLDIVEYESAGETVTVY